MRRLLDLFVLLAPLSACAPLAVEEGAAGALGSPDCASDLATRIFERASPFVERGTVPEALFATTRNRTGDVLIEGPEIFPAMAALIEGAEHSVAMQTYVWEPDTDPTRELLAGIEALETRRLVQAPEGPAVELRILVDASSVGFGSKPASEMMPVIRGSLEALALDPRAVRWDVGFYEHALLGNLHVKTLVVDGVRGIVTGANPQAHHDYSEPWHDAGFFFEGDVALALLSDFIDAWSHWGDPPRLPVGTLPVELEDACVPMLVVGRVADANPFSNRVDNTQDQALLAAVDAATTRIRIETPNLNDDAFERALVAAVRRGVRVEVVLSRGFNDTTENMPGQGGTNEENVRRLREALRDRDGACDLLRLRWYSWDGVEPIEGNGVRASHTKYASFDGEVAIVGTANMDTQSWNNSREIDVVVDDPAATQAWDARLFEPDFERAIPADGCAP